MTNLAWSLDRFRVGYERTQNAQEAEELLKWGADYLVRPSFPLSRQARGWQIHMHAASSPLLLKLCALHPTSVRRVPGSRAHISEEHIHLGFCMPFMKLKFLAACARRKLQPLTANAA